jgi:hypothetical protein
MPATRHKFSCGHRGFGAKCHRCALGDKLEARNKEGDKAEAKRLHDPQKKKGSKFTPTGLGG